MSYIKKVITGFAMLTLVASAAPVAAQTTSDLQAQIAALLAQVNALTAQLNAQGGTTVTVTFNRNLTVGSTGADVLALQQFLNARGYAVASVGAGSPGNETQYFGGLTKAALARFQAANNIAPAVGFFGPITRSAVNAMVSANTGGTGTGSGDGGTTTPPPADDEDELEGGAGSISDADFISSLNNEEVGEGEEDVEVAGLEIEADEGSDIRLTAVRLVFVQGTANRDFDRYAEEVSVWFEGEEVARVDADEFDDDNNFSRTLSLDGDSIIRMDEVGDLVVAVSGVSNLDSADEGETWTVEIDTVRFQDAQGAVISDTATGDIGATRTFSFEAFASAADVELEVVETGDNPEGQIVEVDDSGDTDNVVLIAGEFRNNGDSDIEIKEVVFTVTVGGATSTDAIASSFNLVIDGDEVESVNASSATSYTFDDVDFDLGGGDSVDFQVRVDANEIGANFDEGDSLTADLDADDIVAEDEQNDDLAAGDLKGSVAGEEQVFFTVFPEITVIDTDASYVGDNTANANVSFVVDVRAIGGTIFLNGDNATTTADEAFLFGVLGGDANTSLSDIVHTTSGSFTSVNGGTGAEYYSVANGATMRLTMNGSLSQGTTTVPAGAEVTSIQFGTADTSVATRSAFTISFDDLLDELETNLLTLIGA